MSDKGKHPSGPVPPQMSAEAAQAARDRLEGKRPGKRRKVKEIAPGRWAVIGKRPPKPPRFPDM